MTDAVASDGRSGLPPRVVDDLLSATRVYLAPKDSRTTVIGYWVERWGLPFRPVTERFGAVVIEGEIDQGEVAHPIICFKPGRGVRYRKVRITPFPLRPGDILRAPWSPAGLDLWLRRDDQEFLVLPHWRNPRPAQ